MVETACGFDIEVNLDDQIGRDVFFHGVYEPVVTAVIRHTLRPGGVFFDIGANIGFFTLLAARCVAPSGCVHAFEPNAACRRMLCASLRCNGVTNVHVSDEACMRSTGSFRLIAAAEGSLGTARVVSDVSGQGGERVSGIALDDFIRERRISRIDLLKMDIEGGENAALEGMRETLESGVVDKLLIEFHPCMLGGADEVERLRQTITGCGYAGRQLREHAPGVWSRYATFYSDQLFLDDGCEGTSMRETATPQFLFEKRRRD
jgi:FkbM family methyltransferase